MRAIATALATVSLSACQLPSNAELEFALQQIGSGVELKSSRVDRSGRFRLLASDTLTAAVELPDGKVIRFARVGYNSFGANAVNVIVSEAGGLVPRIASCAGVAAPNLHRDAPLGHHFQPAMFDLTDAVRRSREVLEEIQFWPQCPQSWEVQDKFGANYRYCAHRKDTPVDPPPPSSCT